MIIQFELPKPITVTQLNIFVRSLCAVNVLYLRAHPKTPDIYKSGVRYETQPEGCEHFKAIPLVLEAGSGDCDQLAPWRAAELRVRHGIKALPEVRQMGAKLWHVYVRMPNGKIEDVSARLGMPVPRRLVEAGRRLIGGSKNRNLHAVAGHPAWAGHRRLGRG